MGSAAEKNSSPSCDVHAIVEDIRTRIKKIASDPAHASIEAKFQGSEAQFSAQGQSRRAGELVHSSELRYVNVNHAYSAQHGAEGIISHRGGMLGRLVVAAKRRLVRWLWNGPLKTYLDAEKNFSSNLVRYLNDVSRYVDARDATNFWELIRKIDVDVGRVTESTERLIDAQRAELGSSLERVYATISELATRCEELQREVAVTKAESATVARIANGLESIVSRLSRPTAAALPQAVESLANPALRESVDYLLLENRYRGDEAHITEHLRKYVEVFAGSSAPVLEIGSGRGELQMLLKQAQIPSYGVDMDAAMVRHAQERGASVQLGDGIAHLRSVPDKSLGGIIAIQVIEHLTHEQLLDLCRLCAAKLVDGGTVVFETINPTSVVALSNNYFRDPTHVFPRHPDTMAFIMQLVGFSAVNVEQRSPFDPRGELQPIPTDASMGPRMEQVVALMNRNFTQLNRVLYGNMDYAVIARR